MAKLIKMKVLVIGLKGVGIEVAKNLILAGPGAVTLYDDDIVTISDLGTNFYLKESDVGHSSVSDASLAALKSLNPLVQVTQHKGKLTTNLFSSHTVVVDCGLTMTEAKRWNRYCVPLLLYSLHSMFFVNTGALTNLVLLSYFPAIAENKRHQTDGQSAT